MPGRDLALPSLPFTAKVVKYWRNSTNVPPIMAKGPAPVTQGSGLQFRFDEAPLETRLDRRNIPTAYVELLAGGRSLGTWATSAWLDEPQSLTFSNRTYTLALRPVRYYQPFALELQQFRHDKYAGTEIPMNFSSRVRVIRHDTGEDREVLIYMNNPLRYAGETFYQSGYDENDPKVTILQVVRNPGWLTPYVGCILVGVGLVWQFLTHLIAFARKRARQAALVAAASTASPARREPASARRGG